MTNNIASLAKIEVLSELDESFCSTNLTDGIVGVEGKGIWACKGQTASWGYIKYPWVKLTWENEHLIDKIIIYDRPSLKEHIAGGTLYFSDGSEISVFNIPNNGFGKAIHFHEKKVSWVKFVVTDGQGKDLGLSEIEVFPSINDEEDKTFIVDPYIETTKGRFLYFATGSRPFGMISSAPITRNKNQWGGGYNYNDKYILGFGQLHDWLLSGPNLMFTTGNIDLGKGIEGWKSKFDHQTEIVQPGYQRVFLEKYGLWVEQTCTDRVSFYKIKCTKDSEFGVILGLEGLLGNVTMKEGGISIDNDREILGSYITTNRLWGGPDSVKVFFDLQFDREFDSLIGNSEPDSNLNEFQIQREDEGYVKIRNTKALFDVCAGDSIKLKIAISFTSTEEAKNNLEKELNRWNFGSTRKDAHREWNDWLGKINVKGGTTSQRVKFYTDLWHVLLGRHKINDYSGSYPDYSRGIRHDGFSDALTFTDSKLRVRQIPKNENGELKFNMYNSDAFWLTQWNINVLWGLAWPKLLDDFSASLVQYAENGGLLPRGPNAGGYSFIMTGSPATNLITSAFQKGLLRKIDNQYAFKILKKDHLPGGMMGYGVEEKFKFYIKNGWCPNNAGLTLQWSFEDWSLAQMAKKLNKDREYKYFKKRSEGWTACFNKEKGLIFPKDKKGEWTHLDPLTGQGWIEANSWQGTWSISQGIAELSDLMGGKNIASTKLDYAFTKALNEGFISDYGEGYINYSNQPACSDAHIFNYLGKPWLTQKWVREVRNSVFSGITPDKGYGGHDEDQGQMGGISALMAMGLFSVRGTNRVSPVYEITSPIFDTIIITLDSNYYEGKEFVIKTHGNDSPEDIYIQKTTLNGMPLSQFWFPHSEFQKGGVLDIWLGPEPNKRWGENRIIKNDDNS